MKLSRKTLVVGVVLALVFIGGTTWVFAQGDGFDVHACVNPSGGIRIVDDADSCRPRETLLEWNIEGPEGPQGEQGPQGDPGPPGVLDFYTESSALISVAPGEWTAYARCSIGDEVTGGGFEIGGDGCMVVRCSSPGDYENEWKVEVYNSCGVNQGLRVWARCAQMPSTP